MNLGKYVTVVIRMPEDAAGKEQVREGLRLLDPHKTAMSLEDEMTVLELIEQHEDFKPHIADEARAKAAEIHAAAEALPARQERTDDAKETHFEPVEEKQHA